MRGGILGGEGFKEWGFIWGFGNGGGWRMESFWFLV